MSSNRRNFLLGAPVGALGLLEMMAAPEFAATAASLTASDKAALDFWVYGMGLSPSALAGAAEHFKGASKDPAGPMGGIQREPSFLFSDGNALVPMDAFDDGKLLADGDTQVEFQLQRLRLNGSDQAHYQKFTSGAIYFEVQQQNLNAAKSASVSAGSDVIHMASTAFSAFSPGSHAAEKKGSGTGTKPATAKTQKSGGRGITSATKPQADSATKSGSAAEKSGSGSGLIGKAASMAEGASGAPGKPIALQSSAQAQVLPLPNGAGKAAFTAFVKDPRSSLFGSLFKALAGQADGAMPMYAQLLSIGMVAVPALAAIQKVISNIQIQGSNQEPIIQGKTSDIAATRAAATGLSSPLKLISGDYVVIPQDHGPLIKPELKNYKIYNGFLVPREAGQLDITEEMVQNSLPGVSYLTISIRVKKTKFTPAVVTQV